MNRYLSLQVRISGLYHFFLFFKYSTECVCYFTIKTKQRLLAVQWLGLHAFSALVQVQSLVGKLQSCKLHGLTKKKKKKEVLGCQKYKVKERLIAPSKSPSETDVRDADLGQARLGGVSLETLPGGWRWSREAKARRKGRRSEGHPGHSPPLPQVQEVQPITSYDAAGSFLLLGCNNGSIYYVGEQRPAPQLSESLPSEVGEEGKGWATLNQPAYPLCPAHPRCPQMCRNSPCA